MKCQVCQMEMVKFEQDSVQGWLCQNCGWSILTSKIDNKYNEPHKYSICIQAVSADNIDISIIKTLAQIAKVNYLTSKKILSEGNYIIRNLSESEIEKIKKSKIPFKKSGNTKAAAKKENNRNLRE